MLFELVKALLLVLCISNILLCLQRTKRLYPIIYDISQRLILQNNNHSWMCMLKQLWVAFSSAGSRQSETLSMSQCDIARSWTAFRCILHGSLCWKTMSITMLCSDFQMQQGLDRILQVRREGGYNHLCKRRIAFWMLTQSQEKLQCWFSDIQAFRLKQIWSRWWNMICGDLSWRLCSHIW